MDQKGIDKNTSQVNEDTSLLTSFTVEDFDAYLPDKWNSNMFTLARRKVKNKLEKTGQQVLLELCKRNFNLVMRLSDEFPSIWNKKNVSTQWMFFSRDEKSQKELSDILDKKKTLAQNLADPTPRYRHLFLGACIDKDFFEVGLRMHYDAWVDRENFLNLLKNEDKQNEFFKILSEIPNHYQIGIDTSNLSPVLEITRDNLNGLLSDYKKQKNWFFTGARIPRDQALVIGGDIAGQTLEAIRVIAPLYKFIAWSSDNDAISMDELMEQRALDLQISHKELEQQKNEKKAILKDAEKEGMLLRKEIEDKVRSDQAWRKKQFLKRESQTINTSFDTKSKSVSSKSAASAMWDKFTKPAKKTDVESQRNTDYVVSGTNNVKNGIIMTGSRVRIISGFLKGKVGVVHSIDDKDRVMVTFGALSSKFDISDMELAGKVIPPNKAKKKYNNKA